MQEPRERAARSCIRGPSRHRRPDRRSGPADTPDAPLSGLSALCVEVVIREADLRSPPFVSVLEVLSAARRTSCQEEREVRRCIAAKVLDGEAETRRRFPAPYNTSHNPSADSDVARGNPFPLMLLQHLLLKLMAVPGRWLIFRRRAAVVLNRDHGAGRSFIEAHRREGDQSATWRVSKDLGARRLLTREFGQVVSSSHQRSQLGHAHERVGPTDVGVWTQCPDSHVFFLVVRHD
jgi:hypothetical protein